LFVATVVRNFVRSTVGTAAATWLLNRNDLLGYRITDKAANGAQQNVDQQDRNGCYSKHT
jgi:hypothetical protein